NHKSQITNQKSTIPMSSPDISEAEREAVAAVMRTPNLSMGAEVLGFEQAVSEYCGSRHAIAVSSGTAGLHLCVHAAGIGPGDLVITTPFSFVASANVLLFERAVPVFVDLDPETGNIQPGLVRLAAKDLMEGGEAARKWLPRKGVSFSSAAAVISGEGKTVERSEKDGAVNTGVRLKAILPVDVFGQPADLDPIRQTADRYGLKVIEDSCEALGAEYKGAKAGTLGDYGVFAFYPNKQITTGEGAVIITDDDQAAGLMRALRNQGRAPGDTWLGHTLLGYNYRLDEMSSALGRVQMGRLDELLNSRQQVADWYAKGLAGMPGVETQHIAPSTTRMSWFV
ncbi:unnamed protein product, partial [marine sediment metagenome]